MEKITGRVGNASLSKALGHKVILGCEGTADYAIKLAKMDTDALYRHGMKQYGIKPSNRKNARGGFEKKCIAEFKKDTGQMTQINQPKMPRKKKERENLQRILDKAK